MTTCAIISFRLCLTDGVSIVADTWAEALRSFGYEIVTVAGEGPVDRIVAGLALDATEAPPLGEVEDALRDVDLVVVENLCTIPMNLPASRVVAEVLRGRPAILHHHDPPWQRPHYAHVTELPPTDPAWSHVTINELTGREFGDRGIDTTTIYNGFSTLSNGGARSSVREQLGVAPDELLLAHPVRAIPRKGVPAAIDICEQLGATYWLLGGAEDGYTEELDRLLLTARCRVIRHALPHSPDIYAAPDAVLFPSTWEGFGNPPIEASIHRRPVLVGPYPVGAELRSLGFSWFDANPVGVALLRSFLDDPDDDLLTLNRTLAIEHFSLEAMSARLYQLLDERGWLP